MKLQLRDGLLEKLTLNLSRFVIKRNFASNKIALKSKNATNLKKNPSKVPGGVADISKMPQPHPVLTPLSRSAADQASIELLPKIELIEGSEKYIYRIELDKELQKRLPKGLAEVSDHFGENVFVLRKDFIEQIRGLMDKPTDNKILIDGPNGAGKSVLLMQMYAAVRDSVLADENKLVLYVPNVHKWTTGYFPYYPEEVDGIIRYKQPELALEILHLLSIQNSEKMPKGFASKIEEAKLDSYNRAIPLYEQTLGELKGKELVLFLDGVNGLIEENSLTGYMDREGNPLSLKDLPLSASFFASNFKGKVIGALTHSNPALPTIAEIIQTGFEVVKVTNYSNEDLKRILQLYSQLGHCTSNKSDQFVAFKAFVSGSNGRKLYKTCEYDSIYYKPQ